MTADPGLGYSCFSGPGIEIHGDLGGWAPGNEPARLPEGVGRLLPGKADVVVQIHYHPSGKPETDRSRIGLALRQEAGQADRCTGVLPSIRPQDRRPATRIIEAKAQWRIPDRRRARMAVTPHMHMLGRDMHMAVTYPDGRDQDLITIADWDFGWQNTYYFEKPLDLPEGDGPRSSSPTSTTPRQSQEPEQATQAGEVGRGDHRRDVHRLHRHDQEGPGPHPSR